MNLNEAKNILHEKGLILVDKILNENESEPRNKFYTGLLWQDGIYAEIVSSALAQITDGIGEGSDRTAGIFRYYFNPLCGQVTDKNENGEYVIFCSPGYMDLLIRCIWRVAAIEREDRNTEERDLDYDYLDANWKDICRLQAALKKIIKDDFKTTPMTEEQKEERKIKIELAKKKAEEKTKEEARKAEEEKKAKELEAKKQLENKISDLEKKFAGVVPDEKDKQRAKDAYRKYSKYGISFYEYFYKGLVAQLNKIGSKEKAKRRIVAFFDEAKNKNALNEYNIKYFTQDIDLSKYF